jgi:hypothetical protein
MIRAVSEFVRARAVFKPCVTAGRLLTEIHVAFNRPLLEGISHSDLERQTKSLNELCEVRMAAIS